MGINRLLSDTDPIYFMSNHQSDFSKKILFEIARESLKKYLESESIPDFTRLMEQYPELKEKRGSFVTLYLNNQLKGCIGRLEGERSLAEDIAVNSVDAAFYDNRFSPLMAEQYSKLKIEISLLTKSQKISFKNEEDLFKKIDSEKCGVILKMGSSKSTYLPQVWESYDTPQAFMRDLALKGGFPEKVWNDKKCEVYTYTAKVLKED